MMHKAFSMIISTDLNKPTMKESAVERPSISSKLNSQTSTVNKKQDGSNSSMRLAIDSIPIIHNATKACTCNLPLQLAISNAKEKTAT